MNVKELMPFFTWSSIIFACIIVVFVVIKAIESRKTINSYVKYQKKVYNDKRKKRMEDEDPFKDLKDPWKELDKKVGNK